MTYEEFTKELLDIIRYLTYSLNLSDVLEDTCKLDLIHILNKVDKLEQLLKG